MTISSVNRRCLIVLALAVFATLASAIGYAQVAPKDASERTKKMNAEVYNQLPFSDTQDFEDAKRGLIATLPDEMIKSPDGTTNWDLRSYDFLKDAKVPDTVNPSLWRIAQLNLNNGLFKVSDHIYQVRGYDLSNMTIVEGTTGLIVIDPLVTKEVAQAALQLYYQHRPKKPVAAVMYTHSHADHYGGVKGVTTDEEVKSGKVKILAPDGFLKEAVSENVLAGNAMGRRTLYQYGAFLPKGPRGQLDAGLGKTTSIGNLTLIAPTDIIKRTGETRTVAGVNMEFLLAPNTEAPAEMLIYFPQDRVLDAAEDATHTLHNLYTLRGAQVRDASAWWKTLNAAIITFGPRLDIVIAQHHWPTWGQTRVIAFLESQRDLFKYIHDQTLRLANEGYTPIEIGEMVTLPDSLGQKWSNRGYYGSVNHDAKGVYQRYLGWYDSNPAHLYPLPSIESAKHYVEYMGGSDAIIQKAKKSFGDGEYRWVAEVMDKVVFADPSNQTARNLEADALEQLGYETENPTWRNEFLMGAFELRNGVPKVEGINTVTQDAVRAMSTELLLDYTGVRLNGPKADGKTISIAWTQPENGEVYAVQLENSTLIYTKGEKLARPDVTLNMSHDAFAAVLMGGSSSIRKKPTATRRSRETRRSSTS